MDLLVAVLEVVAASSPDPVAVEVAWPARPGAPAGAESAVPAGARDAVHHPRRRDGVGEGRLPAGCQHTTDASDRG